MKQMPPSRKVQRKKRKAVRFLKIFMTMTLLAFLAFTCLGVYVYFKVSSVASESTVDLERGDKSEKRIEAVDPSKDNFSVLLLGDDSRPGEARARTDAMLVATFNKEDQSIILTSIPRDSRVEIVGRGHLDKINHAHAYGGIDMTIDTVEHLLDIPIDYYGIVRFQGLIDIVDALGGIEVEVPFDFEEKDTNNDWIQFQEGLHTLDGEEALAFARMRKHPQGGGDLGRGQRQQQVIEGIIKKAASFSSITRFDDVLDALGENIQMNFTFNNLVALHSYASSISEIETLQLQGTDLMLNGIYYYELDQGSLFEIQTRLKKHLEIDGHTNDGLDEVQPEPDMWNPNEQQQPVEQPNEESNEVFYN
ncbi:LCP family protein [Halalkalibacterium halodurans]|uniref:LCP family protein n=1 Tax=Halalkalibacterium halodurans TaxID=86665 RepID=UPI002E1ED08F|nr:LCP family protein [Halalkalibacterium halodurans]MED4083662.1 LCP family protein [Halalkalibacterium halodurans]MED4106436.1 LCP family protein [Halalkalibacterium halodurans]MED4107847.1 LCP family protein [Halalkalibacterium halodurans]MED4124242.1 LCP family protein [Halalkalibacterium halodurans]